MKILIAVLLVAAYALADDKPDAKSLCVFVLPDNVGGPPPMMPYSNPPGQPHFYQNSRVESMDGSHPLYLKDLLNGPVVLVLREEGSDDDMVAHLCHKGLSSLSDEVNARLYDSLKPDSGSLAILFDPARYREVNDHMGPDLTVNRFAIERGIKMLTLTTDFTQDLPWIIVHNKDDMERKNSLKQVGTIRVQEKSLTLSRDDQLPALHFKKTQSNGCMLQNPMLYTPYRYPSPMMAYPPSPVQVIVYSQPPPAAVGTPVYHVPPRQHSASHAG